MRTAASHRYTPRKPAADHNPTKTPP